MIDTLRQRDDDNYIDRDMIYTEDEYSDLKEKLEEAENKIEDLEDKLDELREYVSYNSEFAEDWNDSLSAFEIMKILIKGE